MNDTRMQHFVPRSYLQKFTCEASKNLRVFDKLELRSFGSSAGNILRERDLYDLPPEVVQTTNLDKKYFENEYGRLVDGTLMKAVHQYVEKTSDSAVDLVSRFQVSRFLVFQYFRTRSALNLAIELRHREFESIAQEIIRYRFGENMEQFTPTLNPRTLERQAILDLCVNAFDINKSKYMVMDIASREWELGKNNTENSLYTSDSPVAVEVMTTGLDGVGLLSPGTRIVLPITPKYVLIISERRLPTNCYPQKHGDWCRERELDREEVISLNQLQVIHSGRWVISDREDFTLVKKLCETDPSLRNPQPRKVSIKKGPLVPQSDGTYRSTIETIVGARDSKTHGGSEQ